MIHVGWDFVSAYDGFSLGSVCWYEAWLLLRVCHVALYHSTL